MRRRKQAAMEIASFNEGLVSFDSDDLSLEELERRFELALATVPMLDGACGTASCCEVICDVHTCGTYTVCCSHEGG